MRRHPRTTLFPYTTLFRSTCGLNERISRTSGTAASSTGTSAKQPSGSGGSGPPSTSRSEEHTSELQSHVNLVCRLLLEKKKLVVYRGLSVALEIVRTIFCT